VPAASPFSDTPPRRNYFQAVGEHAYYLTYQNKRPDHIDAWWNAVTWAKAAGSFAAVSSAE
jgi:superoxide dismutase